MDEISALLAAAEENDDPARLERTLGDGYARALALEGELRRLRARVALSGAASRADDAGRRELEMLVHQVQRAEGTAGVLRERLARLRRRHSAAVRDRGGESRQLRHSGRENARCTSHGAPR
jgi:hypothetical protein